MILLRGRAIELNHLGWRKCVQEEQLLEGSLENEGREGKIRLKRNGLGITYSKSKAEAGAPLQIN